MPPTACLLIIGNEILSGRTQDANIRFIATGLAQAGIALEEIRVIPDKARKIVETVATCRTQFDHVFTTGGIGPTHDDITAGCVAEAVGVPLECHEESFKALEAYLGKEKFNKARQRMAWLPRGAVPIRNSVSIAPGFSIANVHVMAGVPSIMQSMFSTLLPTLQGGAPLCSVAWHADLREGSLAEGLEAIQNDFPELDLGSYPFERNDGRKGVSLVAKGYDEEKVKAAGNRIRDLIVSLGVMPVEGEPSP
ncbi:competence/damage-inducible protein A [Asaia prunellae]|uniref:competence/damage-inducible protein A n=1 Tax=Asaia prunellae TaxID=610245 RepID=UPI00046FB0CA|nr:molybdopterin-binding protein [Asaia prunellae]